MSKHATVHTAQPAPARGAVDVQASNRIDAVREAAYALYLARDRIDGHDLDDWLQAESRVAASKAGSSGHKTPPPKSTPADA